MRRALELAIEELRPSFAADSFAVTLDQLSDRGDVVIAIEAMPGACLDCMVPDTMLQQVVEVCVRRHAPGVKTVAVVKRGIPSAPLA
jgi:Fe-S cluster biogenesis protein NfuA